jgi:hypothetical protein
MKDMLKLFLRVIGVRPEVYDEPEVRVERVGGDLRVVYTQPYRAPVLSLDHMQRLKDYYGATTVVVDREVNLEGCETCDYGSAYGHDIRIVRPTRNLPDRD